ncbi:MAG TPA: class I SAM-dependent methyltransferase [Alphaproteobacteria bacterium]|nr:class I SAM-dependent methyltransferase [Alphaproteobacteria bacterium]
MSRLDSFIRRMKAQRACLNLAADKTRDIPGPVLELGLGNGRTYDHLREILPGRRIFVFERQVQAHPGCIPPEENLFLGDFRDTLPGALATMKERAALVHADYGAGTPEYVTEMSAFLADTLPTLVKPGALIISDYPIDGEGWTALPLPEGVQPNRYFIRQA